MKLQDFNWEGGIFLIAYQLAAVVLLPMYLIRHTPASGLWTVMVMLVILCGVGITSLYHRCYSHRAYKIHPFAESVLLFFATLATQGSVIDWAHDHRLHHRFVDTDQDPYAITKGFWHAHFLWMMKKRQTFNPNTVGDLMQNKLLVFQYRYYIQLLVVTHLFVILFFGLLLHDIFGAFVILFLVRLFINHHTTWFINSLAHYWGSKPYSSEHSAVNNWIISFLTYGEGYHNYHHTFAADYRNGVRWYQFDPTKVLIWILEKMGLASNLMKTEYWVIQLKLIQEDCRLLTEKLAEFGTEQRTRFEKTIQEKADSLKKSILTLKSEMESHSLFKKDQGSSELARESRHRLAEMKKHVQTEFKSWARHCDQILRLKPTSIERV